MEKQQQHDRIVCNVIPESISSTQGICVETVSVNSNIHLDNQNIVSDTETLVYGGSQQSFDPLTKESLKSLLILPGSLVANPVVISAPTVPDNTTSGPLKKRKIDRIENERKYIHSLLDKNLLIPGETYKHQVPTSHKQIPNLDDYLMLDVIFWDLQLACQRNGFQCKLKCPECGTPLSAIPLGPKKRFMMRKLYCVEQCVLLITTMFRCSGAHKHELLGYDPRLLQSFLTLELPFLLFHRAGTTRRFATHVLDSMTREVKISQIHDELVRYYTNSLNSRRNAYVQACTSYQAAQTVSVDNLYFDDFPVNNMLNCPSLALVRQCCLAMFEENETLYKNAIESVTADKYFYMNDSFKLPSGFQASPSTSSKRAQKDELKFKRVLVILNEKKQIMAWQLTKENSFKEVQPVMEELKSRHANTRLLGCFTNRCCEWADQLRHHFGDEFDVKANVEFALETFTKHIDASNESQHKCFREFKRIFRSQVDDQNGCETMVTADAVILADRYSDFLSSWRNVKCHSGKSVLSDEVFKEIVVMEDHVKRGCYTNIPQYCIRDSTTHGFVEIHQSLRRWISHSRTGIPIAMALISLGFHEFNKKRGIQSVDVGLVLKENNGPYVNLSSVSEHKMTKLNYVIGILEKGLTLGAQGSNEHGIIVEPGSHISRFLMYLKSYKSIVQFVPDILSAPRLVPYFLSPFHLISVPYFLKTSEINTEYFNDVEALRCCINRLKFEHASDISEDSSNLLFCVVSFLKNVYENTPKTNFSETASYPSENTSETASYLHKNALETANYFEYLRKIHGLDFDSNSLDELMELSKCRAKERVPFDGLNTYEFVANLFHVVVLILTNLRRFPVLPVYPRSWHPQSPQVLLLLREDSHIPILLQLDVDASLTSGDGGDEDLPLDSKFKNFRCRCGRGKAERNQKPKCVTIKDSRYPSRCLCFRAGESCSSICDCRACNNPCGTRVSRPRSIADEAESLKRRKRNTHEGQQSLKRILSRVLVKPINEPNSWMFTEYILFEYALSLIAEDLNTEEDNLLTWSNVPIIIDYITEKYHHLVNLLTGVHGMNHWLRKKGYEDMEKRYTERQDDVTTNFELLE